MRGIWKPCQRISKRENDECFGQKSGQRDIGSFGISWKKVENKRERLKKEVLQELNLTLHYEIKKGWKVCVYFQRRKD